MTYLAGHGNSENKSVISISGYWIQSGTNMWIIQLHFFWRQNYCAYSLAIILVSLYFLLPVNNVSGNKQCGDYQPFIQEVFLPIFSVWLWSPAEAFSVCQNEQNIFTSSIARNYIIIPSPTIPTISFRPKYCLQYVLIVNGWILNFQSTRELRGLLQRDEWVRTISWNQFSNIPSCDGVMWHHLQFSEILEIKPLIHDRSRDLRKCIRVQCSGPNPELHSA